MFESAIPDDAMVIWDDTDIGPDPGVDGAEFAGYEARDWEAAPYGATAQPFPSEWRLSYDEIHDIIQEKAKHKAGLRMMCEAMGLKPLHQGSTLYCWANGVVDAVQVMMAKAGYFVPLSPASVAGPITRYRNVGGWGQQAHAYIQQHGIAPQSTWPPNAIDSRYAGPSQEVRKKYGVFEWFELPRRDLQAALSLMAQDVCVPMAHNWMRHLVNGIEPVYKNGQWGYLARNSGYARDATGHTIIMGNRAVPDEACCVRVALPG